MTHPLTNDDKILLEDFVDAHGLANVLSMLAEIASEKAEHIAVNWQDNQTARCWFKAASRVETAADAVVDYVG